jgi:hypothetical protein
MAARSDNLFKDTLGILAFVVVGYLVLRYILPSFTQALSTAGTGFFGPSSTGQGALPYGFSYRNANTQFSTSGSIGALLQQLLGKQQPQQSGQGKAPSAGLGGGGGGGGLPFSGLLPASNPLSLQELQTWQQAGNTDLSNYFASNPATFDPAYYDSPTLDSIQIPSTPYTPQGIDLSGAAVPLGTPAPGDSNVSLAGGSGSLYDPNLDSYSGGGDSFDGGGFSF